MSEGMKFDDGKARWELVPTEYFVKMSQAVQPFIEKNLLKADEKQIVFDPAHIYNIARASIFRWKMMGTSGMVGRQHPLMDAAIGILMLVDGYEVEYDKVFTEHTFEQRWDLINPKWTTKLAEVYAYGAKKYEDDNWQGVAPDRYYAALNRHLDAYADEKNYDDESGFHHLYHAAWNCIALMWLEAQVIPEVVKVAARKLQRVQHIEVSTVVKKKATKKKTKKKINLRAKRNVISQG